MHITRFLESGQFLFHIGALEEQTPSLVGCGEWRREIEETTERRHRPGGHDIGVQTGHILGPRGVNPDGNPELAGGFAKEHGLALVAFDQMDVGHAKQRQDEAREAGAAAEVDKGAGARWQKRPELGRVEEMPAPDIVQGLGADQVDRLLPFDETRGVGLEAGLCFT